ncbi:ABC transporter permease [Rhodococcus erythropolis]|uniref:ABC transporter permease n=1 Tax=Rhodococcus erythropolis TaxID=1833 RepID=A0A5N5DYQ5_RHOER|nr:MULTISPECIES: ABC transporter permease [Rhodococcus]KAB2582571.1 ABC transporter permease [Rhodococcus erythropolis]MDJ0011736.1 ABC transporter permease [Rhodococcus erythropolis]MDV8010378.1 ABC transporter permease [Rhodococcus sp. IEGM 1241]WMN01863.1 ABC transporter permease [Rhodococcus erythropolis]
MVIDLQPAVTPSAVSPRAQFRRPSVAKRVAVTILRSIGIFVPVFVIATFITFSLREISGLSPAYLQAGDNATPELVAQIEREWGLDRPFLLQYFDWLGAVLRGDLGESWYNGFPISELLFDRALISLSIAGLALLIGVTVGLLLGVLAAARPTSLLDRAITAFSTLISTMPPFIVGVLLVSIFAVGLGWFPAAGYAPVAQGIGPWLWYATLPALALSVDTVAEVARQTRVGLVDVYRQNYIVGAQVRGLGTRRIFFVHALRNGIGPTVALLGLKFPALLGGAVVTETIFGISGYGRFAADSAQRGDVPAVQGVLVVSIVLVVAFNLVVNVILNRIIPAATRGL